MDGGWDDNQAERRHRFGHLVEELGAHEGNYSNVEDIKPYLDGEEALPRYVSVTYHGDYVYTKPKDSIEDCLDYMNRVVQDDIYAETPWFIQDLDRLDGRRDVEVTVALSDHVNPEASRD